MLLNILISYSSVYDYYTRIYNARAFSSDTESEAPSADDIDSPCKRSWFVRVNPLMGTLKPQSNGPLYSSTVFGIHWPLMGGLLHLV